MKHSIIFLFLIIAFTFSNAPLHAQSKKEKKLMEAVENGQIEKVKKYLSKGVNVNAKNEYLTTPLHYAARFQDAAMVQLLLDAGAVVNVKNEFGITPLYFAVENQGQDAAIRVKLLLDAGAEVNVKAGGQTPLYPAARYQDTAVVQLLLDAGAEVNVKDQFQETPLHNAACKYHASKAQLLLDAGAEVNTKNYKGNTPLHLAAKFSSEETVNLLIAAGAEINALNDDGETPFDLGKSEKIRYLLGANKQQKLLAILESEDADIVLVKDLIKSGAEVNAKDEDQYTPLLFAAQYQDAATVKLLLDAGAEVNVKNKFQVTPLHFAAWKRDASTVKLLLDAGAKVNVKTYLKSTPLHMAARHNSKETVKLLIEAGAEINALDNEEKTPKTPLDVARKSKNSDAIVVLLEHNAKSNLFTDKPKIKTKATPARNVAKTSNQSSSFSHGNPIRVISNVGFIADWDYKYDGYGYDKKPYGFTSNSIIENQNTKPVAIYDARFKYHYEYNQTLSSGEVKKMNKYDVANFPHVFLLAPNTHAKKYSKKHKSGNKYSDFKVNNSNLISGKVYVINDLKTTNGFTKVTTTPREIKNLDGVKILISFYKTSALKPKGSSTFYKYVPLITVKNTTASKVKLKGSITFDIYYSGYKQKYAINLGRIKPGETEENKGLGDKSPAINWTPEIFIGNIEYPTVQY